MLSQTATPRCTNDTKVVLPPNAYVSVQNDNVRHPNRTNRTTTSIEQRTVSILFLLTRIHVAEDFFAPRFSFPQISEKYETLFTVASQKTGRVFLLSEGCWQEMLKNDSCALVSLPGMQFDTGTMTTCTNLPYARVLAERPSMVLTQHTYPQEGEYALSITASSAFSVTAVASSANISVVGDINVTIINVVEFVKTGEAIHISLEPHSGKFQFSNMNLTRLRRHQYHSGFGLFNSFRCAARNTVMPAKLKSCTVSNKNSPKNLSPQCKRPAVFEKLHNLTESTRKKWN